MVMIDRPWDMLQLVVVNGLCLIFKQQQRLLINHYYKTQMYERAVSPANGNIQGLTHRKQQKK